MAEGWIQAWIAVLGLALLAGAFIGVLVVQRRYLLREAHDLRHRFKSAFDHAPVGMAMVSLLPGQEGRFLAVNPALCDLLGRSHTELQDVVCLEFLHDQDRDAAADALARAAAGSVAHVQLDQRYVRPGGDAVGVRRRLSVVADQQGAPQYAVEQTQDITEAVALQRALASDREFLNALLGSLGEVAIVACDASGNVTVCSPPPASPARTTAPLRWPPELELFDPRAGRRLLPEETPLQRALQGQVVQDLELTLVVAGCPPRAVLVSGRPIRSLGGVTMGAVIVLHDVSARKQAEAALQQLVRYDPLTGLPSRALLLDRLEHSVAVAAHRRSGLALLLIALDRLEVVTDSCGHEAGERLLRTVGSRLATLLRPGDTLASLDGGRFAMVCADVTTTVDAEAVALRVADSVAAPLSTGERDVVVHATIGIALSAEGATAEQLLRDADIALRQARTDQRPRAPRVYSAALGARAHARFELEAGLHRALQRGELGLVYQPIVALEQGTVVGVEALLRWHHPTRGRLSPDRFVQVAEDTGLIVPIGEWVLAQACATVARIGSWGAGAPPLGLSVNVSARQIGQAGLAHTVAEALTRSGLPPDRLCLEVTEHAFLRADGPDLAALKDLGVRLAIDDFGTGYASLHYLRRLPVDVLKIDRSFVAGLGSRRADSAIVAAIGRLGHTLGLTIVAEGVETGAQLRQLRACGIQHGQGFLFARPVPADEIGTDAIAIL